MAVIMVLAMFAVANKTVWGLGPEWCARYMLAKYMLHYGRWFVLECRDRAAHNWRPTQLSGAVLTPGSLRAAGRATSP